MEGKLRKAGCKPSWEVVTPGWHNCRHREQNLWHTVDTQVVAKCYSSDIQVVSKWCSSDVQVMFKWCSSGVQLMFNWYTSECQVNYKWNCSYHSIIIILHLLLPISHTILILFILTFISCFFLLPSPAAWQWLIGCARTATHALDIPKRKLPWKTSNELQKIQINSQKLSKNCRIYICIYNFIFINWCSSDITWPSIGVQLAFYWIFRWTPNEHQLFT